MGDGLHFEWTLHVNMPILRVVMLTLSMQHHSIRGFIYPKNCVEAVVIFMLDLNYAFVILLWRNCSLIHIYCRYVYSHFKAEDAFIFTFEDTGIFTYECTFIYIFEYTFSLNQWICIYIYPLIFIYLPFMHLYLPLKLHVHVYLPVFLCIEFIIMASLRTFFSGWKKMIYILGVNRHTRATLALRLIDTHSVVIWTCKYKRWTHWNENDHIDL